MLALKASGRFTAIQDTEMIIKQTRQATGEVKHNKQFLHNMKPYNILTVVQPGLEEIACREIKALGYHDQIKIRGGIFLKGHLSTVIRLNLACRTISRVLIELAEFEAKSFSQLQKQFSRIPWQDYLENKKICIRVSSFRSLLYHEKAIAERLISSLSTALGKTVEIVGSPDVDNTQLIVIHAQKDVFTVRIDSSGAHLHKRGYGICKEDAPLRETVACALLYSIGWKEGVSSICDPMCGSGTIPIEAALMAKQVPLSAFRNFSLQGWKTYQPEVFEKIHTELMGKINLSPHVFIHASDQSSKAVEAARSNAEKAGVAHLLDLQVQSLAENKIDRNTTVITNPPWGKRIADREICHIWNELHKLAKQGNEVYILLPEMQSGEFHYRYKTVLNFNSGELKVRFIKLEA
jgi:putative N6-adenine-specific DNA methylase